MVLALAAVAIGAWGDHQNAAWLVLLCTLLDKLDGTVARLLKATSRFGVQLDSFSDFVAFGLAPPALVYATVRNHPEQMAFWHDSPGYGVLLVCTTAYVVFAAIRLAKFNVLSESLAPEAPKVFFGLPTTMSGAVVAASLLVALAHGWLGLVAWLPPALVVLGLLMVSNFPLPKMARRQNRWANVFQIANVVMAYILIPLRLAPEYLAIMVLAYGLVGFSWGFFHRRELRAWRMAPHPT
jgi:CDP-diacylglycerol--serine O-phosphatidyltransferase